MSSFCWMVIIINVSFCNGHFNKINFYFIVQFFNEVYF